MTGSSGRNVSSIVCCNNRVPDENLMKSTVHFAQQDNSTSSSSSSSRANVQNSSFDAACIAGVDGTVVASWDDVRDLHCRAGD
uniref:Uncharacterized protein n=1 Tax=Anopheles merus TaxID=30066 RepID=A0A182UVM4_ANOME